MGGISTCSGNNKYVKAISITFETDNPMNKCNNISYFFGEPCEILYYILCQKCVLIAQTQSLQEIQLQL